MDRPTRIQLRRTKGWRMPPGTVKVDRATKWGNPFRVGDRITPLGLRGTETILNAAMAVEAFKQWLLNSEDGQATAESARRELRGKSLGCWCVPGEPCHADVLIEIANAPLAQAK